MQRRTFIKLAGIGSLSLLVSPAGMLKRLSATPHGNPVQNLDEQLGANFVWMDKSVSPFSTTELTFTPPMDDAVIPANMDGLPNDHRYGWMHRYTVHTDAGMEPQVTVSGYSQNLQPAVSVRPVEGQDNLFYVDVVFRTGGQVSSDTVVITFEQVTGIARYASPRITGAAAVVQLDCQPNPVRQSATVRYRLSRPLPVTVRIYNVLGQQVEQFDLSPTQQGQFRWQPGGASGIYLLQLIPQNGMPRTLRVKVLK